MSPSSVFFYGTYGDLVERCVLQRFRRLLDMGVTILEARSVFEKALKSDGTLDKGALAKAPEKQDDRDQSPSYEEQS